MLALSGVISLQLGALGIGFAWGEKQKAPLGAIALWAAGCFMIGCLAAVAAG